MALESTRTIAELKEECENRNLTVIPTGKAGKYLKEDFIKALRADYLVERFGELEDVPFPLRFMLTMDCPMLCKRYAAIKKQDVQISLWKNDGKYAAEEKIDGCFHYSTPVLLADGTTMPIGEIVEKKLSVEVLSFDETTQTLVPRKVVSWFDNGYKKASQWLGLKNIGNTITPFRNVRHQGVLITRNHSIWSEGNWLPAASAKTVNMVTLGMNKTQKQVMYGCVLGDGTCSYSRKEDKNAYFQFVHSVKQKDYFNKKALLFSRFPHKISVNTSGYGSEIHSFRVNACADATSLRTKGYCDGHRKVTQSYLAEVGTLGLAIWFMDDGSRIKSRDELACHSTNKFSRVTFSAYRYTESDVRELVSWLNSFGYESSAHMTTRKSKNLGYVIQLSSKGSQLFFKDIAPYVPVSMEYKLPLEFRGGHKECWWDNNSPDYKTVSTPVTWKFNDSSNRDRTITSTKAYDIEVEGCHSYVANGMVVHNSRSILIYDAERHEFDFFSRHNSVSDFLPISYKDTILVHGNYRGDTSFVLDCEVISTNANVTTKKTCTSQLNSTSAILALDPVQSREIQKNNPLLFVVFDCLYNGVDIRSLPWKDRHVHAEKLAKALSDAGFMCKINPYVLENKKEFYESIIKQGGEGIVLKRTDAPYSSTTSRTDDMVKLKRTVACDLASDIDAWVSGFTEATKGKSNENYIGGLIFSCKVKLKNGETVIREIGRVAGIPQDLRVEMTDYDANGNPKLKQSYYGRVATISGQDISGVNKRLTHCVLKAWRYDKDPSGCEVLSEEELDKLIM